MIPSRNLQKNDFDRRPKWSYKCSVFIFWSTEPYTLPFSTFRQIWRVTALIVELRNSTLCFASLPEQRNENIKYEWELNPQPVALTVTLVPLYHRWPQLNGTGILKLHIILNSTKNRLPYRRRPMSIIDIFITSFGNRTLTYECNTYIKLINIPTVL